MYNARAHADMNMPPHGVVETYMKKTYRYNTPLAVTISHP